MRLARIVYDFVSQQTGPQLIRDLEPIISSLQAVADDYHNQTGALHADLGLELREWALLKRELLEQSTAEQLRIAKSGSGLTASFVEEHHAYAESIIRNLERSLDISGQ